MTAVRPLLPAILVVAAFAALVATPAAAIGCRNRGLLAVAVILVGLSGAFWLVIRGLRRRLRGASGPSGEEMVAVLLLMLPAAYLVLTET